MKDKHKKHAAEHEQKAQPENNGQPPADADNANASPEKPSSEALQVVAPDLEKALTDQKYLRLLADFDNFRKRTLRERAELYQRINAEIMADMLPVLDHLEMALASAAEHKADGAVIDGFKLVAEQFLGAMKKAGLEPIEAEGLLFDPMYHEAISHLPSDTVPENIVVTQVRRGYRIGDRMIRAARVVVSSGKPQKTPETQEAKPALDEPVKNASETLNN